MFIRYAYAQAGGRRSRDRQHRSPVDCSMPPCPYGESPSRESKNVENRGHRRTAARNTPQRGGVAFAGCHVACPVRPCRQWLTDDRRRPAGRARSRAAEPPQQSGICRCQMSWFHHRTSQLPGPQSGKFKVRSSSKASSKVRSSVGEYGGHRLGGTARFQCGRLVPGGRRSAQLQLSCARGLRRIDVYDAVVVLNEFERQIAE